MDLIVEGKGVFLGKHQGRLRVTKDGKTLQEAPIIHLQQVVILDSGVAISSDVVHVCAEEGIPIHFLDGAERAIASLYAAGLTGTVLTRRAQLLAFVNPRGVMLARAFVGGKIENQRALLRYMGKYRKETNPDLFEELTRVAAELGDHVAELERLPDIALEDLREKLLSVEGRAASRYWEAVGLVIPEDLAWPGRQTQGARDPFNAALNYCYAVLASKVQWALVLAGLDPYGGFMHTDRPGRVSLVLDLIEEFRQAVVDRTLIGLVNRGFALDRQDDGLLDLPTRKRLAEKILERLDSTEAYEGKRQTLRIIMQSQARHMATFVRGEREAYPPFVMGW